MSWQASPEENDRLQKMVEQFGRQNPDLSVTLTLEADYGVQLESRLASATPPDLFAVDVAAFDGLLRMGALQPLTNSVAAPGDFYPGLVRAFTDAGYLYCAPREVNTLALLYNREMFENVGVAMPAPDWTWEELRAAAEALTDLGQGVYGLALTADLSRWLAFLHQAGGALTDQDATAMTLDSESARVALEFYVGLVREGLAAQPGDLGAAWSGEAFGRKRVAMVIEGNWIVPYLDEQFPGLQYGVVELPAGPGGKATVAFAGCYALAAAGGNQEAARRLMAYLSSAEALQEWSRPGPALPARQSSAEGWLVQHPGMEPFLRGAAYAQPWRLPAGFEDVVDAFRVGLQRAFAEEQSVDEVLAEVQAIGAERLGR